PPEPGRRRSDAAHLRTPARPHRSAPLRRLRTARHPAALREGRAGTRGVESGPIGRARSMRRVVVIGGGFAGLAAGVALAGRGVAVTILEARPHLGGRAYSFRDDATGAVVDNGQHAMMGCYTETLAFLERIAAARKLVRQERLRVDMID